MSAGGDGPPASVNDPWDAPETEVLRWLSQHGCDIRPGNGYHQKLITAIEVHGLNAFVGQLDRLARAGVRNGDVKGFVFGAIDELNERSRPNLRSLGQQGVAEERAETHRNRVSKEVWGRRIERFRHTGEWEPEWGDKPKDGAA